VVETVLEPLIAGLGADTVLDELKRGRDDPYIAALLVQASSADEVFGERLRLIDVFSDDEIVNGALAYLNAVQGSTTTERAGLRDGRWAWLAASNYLGALLPEEHYRILITLVERVPWDDWKLWMIGDGPLAIAEMDSGLMRRLKALELTDQKLARIRQLGQLDVPPRGGADG
jgi:hypothetical protein